MRWEPGHLRALTLLVAIALLSACARRDPDPLNWRLDAKSPEELREWSDASLPLMPPALREEFTACYNNILNSTSGWHSTSDQDVNNPVCLHLNHRSVREVVIEGLQLGRDALNARLDVLRNSELSLLKLSDDASPAQQERLERQSEELKAAIEEGQKRLATVQKRIDALMAAGPAL